LLGLKYTTIKVKAVKAMIISSHLKGFSLIHFKELTKIKNKGRKFT
jgi:hypothetical protein